MKDYKDKTAMNRALIDMVEEFKDMPKGVRYVDVWFVSFNGVGSIKKTPGFKLSKVIVR